MSADAVLTLVQDGIFTILLVSAPTLIIGLIVGIIVSVFQATTQINEQTLVFVPKIASIFISLIVFGPWMLTELMQYFQRVFNMLSQFP